MNINGVVCETGRKAGVPTPVSKDRVLAHNTVADLYQADKYLHLL